MQPDDLDGKFGTAIACQLKKLDVKIVIQIEQTTAKSGTFASKIKDLYNERSFSTRKHGCFIISFSLGAAHHSTLLYLEDNNWNLFDPANNDTSKISTCITRLKRNDVLENISNIPDNNDFSLYRLENDKVALEHIYICNIPKIHRD